MFVRIYYKVRIPPEDVYQCLLTLAVNALEACAAAERPPVPRVTVTTRREEAENGRSCIAWLVRDNGPGIRNDAGPCREGGEAFLSRKDGGSGIGLFATRRTAREMGVELEFSTVQDGGTLAVLRLHSFHS